MRRPRLHRQSDRFGELLRQTYDDVLREPLPGRLLDLLERLEKDGTLLFPEARAPENDEAARGALTSLAPRSSVVD
jgi:hypothetical protein